MTLEPELQNEPLPTEAPRPSATRAILRFVLDLVETVLLALVLFLGINAVSARVRVDGMSMWPTLNNGQYVLVNRLAYHNQLPERGDIIVFYYPLDPDTEYIKRIIGLPGDHIQIRDGRVTVNGYELEEPYIAAAPNYRGVWDVPAHHVFVLGDNRNDSSDSHVWGTLDIDYIVGKTVLIYWPLQDFGLLQHPQLVPNH